MAEDPLTVHARARVGRMLRGKWTLDRLIGVGGMAAVYQATHRNGSQVAIKMLHPTLMFDTNFAQRLVQEGYVANKINHPSAVRVYDDDTDEVDGAVFLVMELLEGQTLSAVRRQRKRIPELEALKMMVPVLEALGSAHSKGIIHRDIKPENLFVLRSGEVRVLDFGIARMTDGSSMTNTRTGMVVGSPAYMSPEQALGKMNAVGPPTDVYALGATMFALISGTTPHAGESTQEMIVMVATQAARSLTKVMPDVNPGVAKIIDKALSYEREARYVDATEMLAAMQVSIAEMEGEAPQNVLPTFVEDDDEGETRVNAPAVRPPTPAAGMPAAGTPPPPPPAAGANRVGQRPSDEKPVAFGGKLRAPTMAPTGAPMAFGAPVPMAAAPPPPAALSPIVAAPATTSAVRTPPPGLSPFAAPDGAMTQGSATSSGGFQALGALPPMPLNGGGPEVGSTSGPRAGATTGMAWTEAPDASEVVRPRRSKAPIFLGVGALVLISGIAVAAKMLSTDGPAHSTAAPEHTAAQPPPPHVAPPPAAVQHPLPVVAPPPPAVAHAILPVVPAPPVAPPPVAPVVAPVAPPTSPSVVPVAPVVASPTPNLALPTVVEPSVAAGGGHPHHVHPHVGTTVPGTMLAHPLPAPPPVHAPPVHSPVHTPPVAPPAAPPAGDAHHHGHAGHPAADSLGY